MRHFIFIITLLLSITGHAKQTQSVSTEIKNGIPTELWLSAISNRNTKNELKKISSLKKPLSSNELKWKNALQDALPIFESNKQKVNSLFPKVSPPKSIKILLGNQGGNDAFTYKKEYICLDLSEWVQYYGTPKNTDLDRVSRILLHEYAHLVTKAWLEKYPQQADSLYSKALFEMFYEGIGNYFSLSRKWIDNEFNLSPRSKKTLNKLVPVLKNKMQQIALHKHSNSTELLNGLSSGKFDEKWGALPVALWLTQERKISKKTLIDRVQEGPKGIDKLIEKYSGRSFL